MTTRFFLFLNISLCLGLLGCSSEQKNSDFIPSDELAQRSLEGYLQAWQSGVYDQEIPNTKPVVMASDGLRLNKRVLQEYTILGKVPADAPICFAVRLKLTNPNQEIRERYVVVGMDPIWVLRYEDFEMLTHWEHPMPPNNQRKSTNPAKK
jgi:hypothetical protein